MNTLWTAGWVTPNKWGKNSLATGWSVNTRVHEIFAERAKMERKRREEERLKIAEAIKELGMNSAEGVA